MLSADFIEESSPPLSVRGAFHEVHGARLHGFSLLLSLGDGVRAARLAAETLNAGAERADELRHPERAAAWLRSRLLRAARRNDGRGQPFAVRIDVLAALGVQPTTLTGLGALAPRERAALIADEIERLDRRDVAAIVGMNGSALERLIRRARQRYAEAYGQGVLVMPAEGGPLMSRIQSVANRGHA